MTLNERKRWDFINNRSAVIISLFVISLIIKIIFRVDYLEDYDAIDFAYAMNEYHLPSYKPHFPGYPVYIFFGRALYYLTGDETTALTLLNVLFSSLSIGVVYIIALELFGSAAAILSAVLLLANPTLSLLGTSVNSDISALFFLLLFFYLTITAEKYELKRVRHIFFASFFLGVTLGIRVSYAPFILLWMVYGKFFKLFRLENYEGIHRDDNTFISAFAGLTCGVLIWLAPLLKVVGVIDYYYEGVRFLFGHFNKWGGTYFTSPSRADRILDALWQLAPKGLGTYFYDTSLLRLAPTALFLWAVIRFFSGKKQAHNATTQEPRKTGAFNLKRMLLIYIVPYLLWIFFAQNMQKARHVLPLIPIFIILLAHLIIRASSGKKYGAVVIAVALAAIFADTGKLLYEHKTIPPPPYQVMRYLEENSPKNDSLVYCDEAARFFVYYVPEFSAEQADSAGKALDDLNGSLVEPSNIFVLSTVRGAAEIEGATPEKTFTRSRYIYNPYHKITLYRLERESINLLDF